MNAQFGFRIIVVGLFIVHGLAMVAYGTVDDFGFFLDGKGFPLAKLQTSSLGSNLEAGNLVIRQPGYRLLR